jgi:hypothetical protein
LGTPGAGDDGKYLEYDDTTGKIILTSVTPGGGLTNLVDDTTPELGADLQVNDFDISNSDGSNRGDAFVIGSNSSVETSTSQIVSGIDTDLDIMSAGTTSTAGERIAGPVQQVVISDLNAWNDRVHSNCTATKIELSDNFGESGSGAERGRARIRNFYNDLTMNTKGYQFGDFTFARFGDGINAGVFSVKGFTDVDNGTAHIHTIRGVLAAPQADGSDDTLTGANRFTVNQMSGVEASPFTDSVSDVNNVYGFKFDSSNINASSTVSNKYSFYSDATGYELNNAGHIVGNSFGYGSVYDIGTIASTATDFDVDYSNGGLQKVTLTAATGSASTVINAPTNMADGDTLYLIVTCTTGPVGTTGNFTFKTGVGWITQGFGVTANQNNFQLLTIIKSGTKFLAYPSQEASER